MTTLPDLDQQVRLLRRDIRDLEAGTLGIAFSGGGGGDDGGGGSGETSVDDYRASTDGISVGYGTALPLGAEQQTATSFATWPVDLHKDVAVPSWATNAVVWAKIGQAW